MPTQGVDLALAPAALLQRCAGEAHPFLLDGGGLESWGRSRARLGFGPRATLALLGDGRVISTTNSRDEEARGDPLVAIERFVRDNSGSRGEDFPGISIIALSYDLGARIERVRRRRAPSPNALLGFLAHYDWVLDFSYTERRYTLTTRADALVSIGEVRARLEELAARSAAPSCNPTCERLEPDLDRGTHVAAVGRALEHIAAGDIYQVNLAQRFTAKFSSAPAAAFQQLQEQHPMPFAGYFDCGEVTLVSNSPECLVDLRGRTVSTYPIKGTRPRAADVAADDANIRALPEDPKERAEHVMIVDLERNDLGRICRIGSVRVEELMRITSFGTLHHMVSRVAGELRDDVGLAELLRAMFPGGSISGCPKIRAMEIIDGLESVDRGFYTGSLGYACGDEVVLNILIRTAIVRRGRLDYYAGGGIVADSDPGHEYDETLLKAQPFMRLAATSNP